MKAVLFYFFVILAYAIIDGVHSSAMCQRSAELSVYRETVTRKGFSFEKLFVNRSVPVELEYTVRSNEREVKSVSWKLNNEVIIVEDDKGSEVHYVIEHENTQLRVKLRIMMPSVLVTGTWSMTLVTSDLQEHVAECTISAPPVFRPRIGAVRANEGEAVSISCESETHPPPTKIFWQHIIHTDDGQKLEPVQNATFKALGEVADALMEWTDGSERAGFYLCTSSTYNGLADRSLIEVRIKDKLTYLWPSIGIILEIIVLITTIAIYERSQAKRRKAETSRSSLS